MIPKLTQAESEAIDGAIRGRRTIHEFTSEVPSVALVREAIEQARWAPNHHHTEPWRFYLIGSQLGARIAELNAELVRQKSGEQAAANKRQRWRAMPGWLAVTCLRNEDGNREREDYAACCCAIQNLMLALWARGVGMKWGTGKVTRDPRFMALLGAPPAAEFTVGLFWYGYPAALPVQERHALADIVREVS